MRLVLLTANSLTGGPEHRYVAQRLAEAFPSELCAIFVSEQTPPLGKRLSSYWRRYSLQQLGSRVLSRTYRRLQGLDAKREATLQRVLFPDGDPGEMPRQDILRVVPSHNGRRCLNLLDELKPDVIAVYGTMVIRRKVIAAARRGILNMHTGISPRYRGADTIFWPLYNEEPEWVGVTIHELNEGIDAGGIAAIGRPEIQGSDDEDSLFAKSVRVGSELYIQAIRDLFSDSARHQPQDLKDGVEYRSVHRSMAAERKVQRLLSNGMLERYSATLQATE